MKYDIHAISFVFVLAAKINVIISKVVCCLVFCNPGEASTLTVSFCKKFSSTLGRGRCVMTN